MAVSGRTKAAFVSLFSALLDDVALFRGVGEGVESSVVAGVVDELVVGSDVGGSAAGGVDVPGVVGQSCVQPGAAGGVLPSGQCVVFGDVVTVTRSDSVVGGGVDSASSHGSWADEVEEAEAVVPVQVAAAVPQELKPMAVVHGPGPKMLRRVLKTAGIRVPRSTERDLAIACFSRGAAPAALQGAGERLRVLAQVGDAVVRICVVTAMARGGSDVSAKAVSDEVCFRLSNAQLAKRGREAELGRMYVHTESNVTDTMMATMVEAIIGALYLNTSMDNAEAAMRWLNVSS